MPSNVFQRGDAWCARRTVGGDVLWLGSHETREAAQRAVDEALTVPVKKKRRRIVPPSAQEVDALAARLGGDLGRMVLVAAYSGLRLSEVAALEGRDVLRRGDMVLVKVRCGKGGKARTSVVLPEGVAALEPRAGLLFRRREGGAWTRQTVNRRWLVARRDLGLEHVTFHGLRHFHATLLLDRGVAVMDVAAQLGHSDNGELVRATYGHPDVGAALERVASIAGGHDACGA